MESATVDGLTLNRCGATYWDPNQQFGAIWLYSADGNMDGVAIRNVDVIAPTYQGIHLQSRNGYAMNNVLFENITIADPTTYGVQIKAGANGSATFKNLMVKTSNASLPLVANQATGFKIQTENVGKTAPIFAGAVAAADLGTGAGTQGWLADGRRDQANRKIMPGMSIGTEALAGSGIGGKKAAVRVVYGKKEP
jgi:hypothetical protein